MSPRDLVEMAWAIAVSDMPFLWVVRPYMILGSARQELLEGFEAATHGCGMVVARAELIMALGRR